jgi:aspartate aminotransferase
MTATRIQLCRRKYLLGELKAIGYETAPAEGAFYAPGWIRLSYATSMEKLREAMGRIKRVG